MSADVNPMPTASASRRLLKHFVSLRSTFASGVKLKVEGNAKDNTKRKSAATNPMVHPIIHDRNLRGEWKSKNFLIVES